MKDPRESSELHTILSRDIIGRFAPVSIRHPHGTYAITPASKVSLHAVSQHEDLFKGIGIDWGCGTGCLAIVAAKIPAVTTIIGLELSAEDIHSAQQNAAENGVADKVIFLHADSFEPYPAEGREDLVRFRGNIDFIVANPPASRGDDGFQMRRVIVSGASEFLNSEAIICLQISIQYGWTRTLGLTEQTAGLRYERVIASTPWVPFDLERTDLRCQLDDYVAEEARGGLEYTFGDPRSDGASSLNAHEALGLFRESGVSPLTRWQMHLFSYTSTLLSS